MSQLVINLISMILEAKAKHPDVDYSIVCSQAGRIRLTHEFNTYAGIDAEEIEKILDVPIVTNLFAPDDNIYLMRTPEFKPFDSIFR